MLKGTIYNIKGMAGALDAELEFTQVESTKITDSEVGDTVEVDATIISGTTQNSSGIFIKKRYEQLFNQDDASCLEEVDVISINGKPFEKENMYPSGSQLKLRGKRLQV